jgi:prepilin-type N-terminal cleavage/methylation domain-containing protein
MRPARDDETGFTLVELALTMTILGIIMVPLTNFLISYFQNSVQVQERLGDSHDIQIAAAYFSQDVANTGLHDYGPPPESTATPVQSVWVDSAPPPCASGLGNAVLLLKWQSWAPAGGTGTHTEHSAAYVVENGTLHRVTCTGATLDADIPVVYNYISATVACSSTCTAAPAPQTINMTVRIQAGSGDTSATDTTLTGERRQSS